MKGFPRLPQPPVPGGFPVDGTYIYWSNQTTIGRAKLDGAGVNESFISAMGVPLYVAVVPEPTTGLLVMVGVVGLAVRRRHARSASRGERASP